MKYLLAMNGKDIIGGNELKIAFDEEDDWDASRKASDIEDIWAGHLQQNEYTIRLFRLLEIDIDAGELKKGELEDEPN